MCRVTCILVACSLAACVYDEPVADGPLELPEGATLVHVSHALGIVSDGDTLYLSSDPYGVLRVGPDGSFDVIAPGLAGHLGHDATTLFVADRVTDQIVAIDKVTHAQTPIAAGWTNVDALAVDGDWVYFDRYEGGSYTGQVLRVAKAGGPLGVFASGMRSPQGIAFDAHFVYVADILDASVHAFPRAPCPSFRVAHAVDHPSDVIVVGDWLYYTHRGTRGDVDGKIGRIQRPQPPCGEGHDPNGEVLVTGLGHPHALVADGLDVYWTAYFSGLQRAPLAGGPAEDMLGCGGAGWEWEGAPEQGCGAIAMHGDRIVFAGRDPNNGAGTYAVDK